MSRSAMKRQKALDALRSDPLHGENYTQLMADVVS